jgi:hypothetical protein
MATTWSTSNKSAHITLSNGNLTAVNDGSAGPPFSGRSDASISGSQKIYWETKLDVKATTNNDAIGVANSSWTFTDASFIGGDTFSLGYYPTGQVFVNFATLATIATFAQGAIIGQAMDRGADKIWYTLDGLTWNNAVLALQNPVGVIGGITTGITGNLFPSYETWQDSGVSGQWTADFGATTFVYATIFATLQAAGYAAFDGSDTLFGQAVM